MASRRPVTTEGKRPSVSRHSSYCLPILSSNSTAPAATDKAWAVAFKIDVAVILMSVSSHAYVCLVPSFPSVIGRGMCT